MTPSTAPAIPATWPLLYGTYRVGTVVDQDLDGEERLWLRAQLDRASRYTAHVQRLVEQGLATLSPGAMRHLIERQHGEVTRWPLVEVTVGSSAEPSARAFDSMYPGQAFREQIDDLVAEAGRLGMRV